jgi:hypothetical protein
MRNTASSGASKSGLARRARSDAPVQVIHGLGHAARRERVALLLLNAWGYA